MSETSEAPVFIEDIEPGMKAELSKKITDRDIALFAEVSTDHNPLHLDEDYAKTTIFGGRIAHGMLSGALISAVIGEKMPGPGTIYLKQSMTFLAPVRPGDVLRTEVTVTAVDRARQRVTLATCCYVGNTLVVKGEALVKAPSRKKD